MTIISGRPERKISSASTTNGRDGLVVILGSKVDDTIRPAFVRSPTIRRATMEFPVPQEASLVAEFLQQYKELERYRCVCISQAIQLRTHCITEMASLSLSMDKHCLLQPSLLLRDTAPLLSSMTPPQ